MPGRLARHDGAPRHRRGSPVAGDRTGAPHPGRENEARELFERLLALRNDLGLYADEYDVTRNRQVGNFPQAFTHLALISAARVLSGDRVGTRSTTPAPLPRLPAPPRRPARVTLRRP